MPNRYTNATEAYRLEQFPMIFVLEKWSTLDEVQGEQSGWNTRISGYLPRAPA